MPRLASSHQAAVLIAFRQGSSLEASPFEASPLANRLAETTGRIEFTIVTDETFTSSCFPPRLEATQLLSVTKGQTPFDGDFHPAYSQPSQAH
jgi:hypothetical protein